MQLAYTQCVQKGLYDGESPITLQLSVYQAEDHLVQMFHFLQDALALCCKGTGFEEKITLQMAVDADYYATMESGLTDMIFSTWGGSAYDPYGVLYRCYCDAGAAEFPNQMEYGFDAGNVDVKLTIDGRVYTTSLQNWARWAAADTQIPGLRPFGEYDTATRCKLYADLEFAYLRQYVVTPLYYRNSAQMLSQKGNYPTDVYVDPVEFGGIRFYTYFYDDTAWAKIKSTLQY
jgi:ABC-type transport system substrate-binding protein